MSGVGERGLSGKEDSCVQRPEFQLIDRYFGDPHAAGGKYITLGIGDDAAIVSPAGPIELTTASKTLAGGIDFETNAEPSELGPRLVRHCIASLRNRAISPQQLVQPAFATLAVTSPQSSPTWFAAFSSGLNRELQQFEVPLVGGDTTQGPLTITLTIYGWTR